MAKHVLRVRLDTAAPVLKSVLAEVVQEKLAGLLLEDKKGLETVVTKVRVQKVDTD